MCVWACVGRMIPLPRRGTVQQRPCSLRGVCAHAVAPRPRASCAPTIVCGAAIEGKIKAASGAVGSKVTGNTTAVPRPLAVLRCSTVFVNTFAMLMAARTCAQLTKTCGHQSLTRAVAMPHTPRWRGTVFIALCMCGHREDHPPDHDADGLRCRQQLKGMRHTYDVTVWP